MTETWDGRPENPEQRRAHWLRRKGGGLEAWTWDPDADGCGTEYSGAWHEADGDGQPEEMARWFNYEGPCLTPAELAAQVEAAQRKMREDAASLVERIPEWGGQDYYCDSCKSGAIYPDREDVARDLRALPLTPSPLADMLAEAERCGMERAAQIAAMYGQGKQGMAASRQIVAAIRAAAGKEAGQ